MYFPAFSFLLRRNENRLTQKDFSSGNELNMENTSSPTLSSEEFVDIDDDNMYTVPIMPHKDILELVESSKNIIDADSADKN
ncbi:hypothetical protein TNCV_2814011 [Trichonephila clavipes]|nr:hypothetical protein TNCV_2814011 [Trichonephila clavipes]